MKDFTMIENTEDELHEEDELFEHHNIIVDRGQEIIRIDKFLMDRLPNTSRNKIQMRRTMGIFM